MATAEMAFPTRVLLTRELGWVGMILTSDGACVRLRAEASDLLAECDNAVAFLSVALDRKMFADAIDFAGQWLPRRQVVWWGCLCGWQVLRGTRLPPEASAALSAATAWVIDPTEGNRRRAEAAGTAADFTTPAGNLALAAFHSGDSIAPDGLPPVHPAPDLANVTVANAITLLIAQVAPDQKPAIQQQFARLALAVAKRQLDWPAAPAPAVAAGPIPSEGNSMASAPGQSGNATPPPLTDASQPGAPNAAAGPLKDGGNDRGKDIWDALS
jgi:hypothetical protein